MRGHSTYHPLWWSSSSHGFAVTLVAHYVVSERLGAYLFQTVLDHFELFELRTSDLPASSADGGGL